MERKQEERKEMKQKLRGRYSMGKKNHFLYYIHSLDMGITVAKILSALRLNLKEKNAG